jgi:hypothetical protein
MQHQMSTRTRDDNDVDLTCTCKPTGTLFTGTKADAARNMASHQAETDGLMVRKISIWNTHYQGQGDNWRAQVTLNNGTVRSTPEGMTFAQVNYWVACYV